MLSKTEASSSRIGAVITKYLSEIFKQIEREKQTAEQKSVVTTGQQSIKNFCACQGFKKSF